VATVDEVQVIALDPQAEQAAVAGLDPLAAVIT